MPGETNVKQMKNQILFNISFENKPTTVAKNAEEETEMYTDVRYAALLYMHGCNQLVRRAVHYILFNLYDFNFIHLENLLFSLSRSLDGVHFLFFAHVRMMGARTPACV